MKKDQYCNHDCNQGRDCPVRAGTHKPAEAMHQIQEQSPATALDALREAEAALEVAIARILKSDPGHSISVTSEAKALVAVRAALATTTAAAPVLPEPDFLQRHEDVCGDEVGPPTAFYTADTVRALLAAASAPAAPAITLLAGDHSGMKVDYRGLFKQVQRAIKRSDPGYAEMLRQLEDHLQELGQRWYAGDTNVVDEILQLYCIERDARKTVGAAATAAPQAQAVERDALTPAARDVLAERARQVSAEGWTPERDDQYTDCQLAAAAASYAVCGKDPKALKLMGVTAWPWRDYWWKPETYRRNLEKAGALILAEIERIDRAAVAAAKGE